MGRMILAKAEAILRSDCKDLEQKRGFDIRVSSGVLQSLHGTSR